MLKRRQARTNLQSFIEYTKHDYRAAPHHKRICEALEAVERGECDRLAIFMPPRHGKSEIASRRFPAWYIGRNPGKQIICASYGTDLAASFGREVRNIVADQAFSKLFPNIRLAEDSQSAARWHTSEGGVYVAAGIGGALTGKGAHIALVDDPVKDQQDADSERIRETTWDWYASVLRTRLMPKGALILIQTRWNEDDLAGRILGGAEGNRFHVLSMPAIDGEGKALWPESYPIEELNSIRSAVGLRKFAALYQQNPTPEEGTFFQRDWFEIVSPRVPGYRYTSGDFAVTDDGGDSTELGTHAYSGDKLVLGIDGWSGKTTADVWIERLIDQFATHKPLCFFGESGPIRRSIEPFLRRRMTERKTYCRMEWLPRPHDKPTMARPLQAMASMGKVQIADTEYGHHILSQLLKFPGGGLDATDMAGLMGLAIGGGEDGAHPAIAAATVSPKPKRDSWDDDRQAPNWKTA